MHWNIKHCDLSLKDELFQILLQFDTIQRQGDFFVL